eukprot:CAMPEP_0206570378 /NCGR_PEP_ID=MMETSP0325_2-20121206/26995_1 /ASSEMBLY_ACC=CAM_ASM_000347 /TAXON_ID=2866 /ORGANISM="Crypthecodinium cohnii, Strain Seligo" /LENGTH=325 /DNA_ID=CAMNT_0054074141 /DNA_START=52 /DNA_END=1025 /DNA_ORIENTATION=+
MKARFRAIEEAARTNKDALTDFSSTIEEAKVRKVAEDEQKRQLETQLLADQAEVTAKLEAAGAARRAVLFGGLSARETTLQAPLSSTNMTLTAPGGSMSARGPSQRQRTATERRLQLSQHADMMLSAREDAHAVRQKILFQAPGGASKAVGEWLRSRSLQTKQLESTSRPPRQLMSATGAPPFSVAPCSVLPRLRREKNDQELELEMLEEELRKEQQQQKEQALQKQREKDNEEQQAAAATDQPAPKKTDDHPPQSSEGVAVDGEGEDAEFTAREDQMKVENFAGAGHFWHRMQKLEVELLCNAVHLKRHREVLDDVWSANGGKP